MVIALKMREAKESRVMMALEMEVVLLLKSLLRERFLRAVDYPA